ncbi:MULTISPECIES: translocation/assembly module TamB domain-containing protein [unclassified Legionella]|uniref:translocation/assembly module TamB domain-containing protein n=1 Tax=unclassified Legionella TaxID=2622702 RepID=UPI001055F464|nr:MULTISPECIES: translocation/assembly module TamB domain-containing protein [unclassified Legionella]MDI9819152.1 translocation/assembly module TamB domain-containing protein [Legionella sp. PL877]
MRLLSTLLKSVVGSLLLLFILLTTLSAFLLTTTPGLYLSVKFASLFLPGKLQIEKLEGRLIDNFSFGHLRYHADALDIELRNLQVNWKIKELFQHHLLINKLTANQLLLHFNNVEVVEKTTKTEFSLPQLPVNLSFNKIQIGDIQINQNGIPHEFKNLNLQASLNNQQWQINQLSFDFENVNINGQLKGQPVFPYTVAANLFFKSKLVDGPQITGNFKLGGDLLLYHWRGELEHPARLVLNGTLKQGQELYTKAQWHEFQWAFDEKNKFQSSAGQVLITGKIPELTLDLNATVSNPIPADIQIKAHSLRQKINAEGLAKLAQGEAHFNLTYDAAAVPQIKGELHSQIAALNGEESFLKNIRLTSEFSSNTQADLSINGQLSASYLGSPLQANFNYQQPYLNGELTLGSNRIEITGSSAYQWQAKASIPQPKLLHPALSGLETTISANASFTSSTKGEIDLIIDPGSFQLPEEKNVPGLPFHGGQLRAELTPQHLTMHGNLIIDQYKTINLAFKLAKFQLEQGFPTTQPIEGEVRLDVNSLDFIEQLSPELSKPQGQLSATLTTRGTVGKPVVEGNIKLDKGSVSLPQWGLNLNAIQADLQSKNQQWEAQGSLMSNDTTLSIRGQGKFTPHLTGTVNLDSNNLTLINTPEYLINVAPELRIEFTPDSVDLKGKVIIPKAQIKPQSFSTSASLSPDVVFVGAEPSQTSSPFPINTSIQVEMGNDVYIDVKGIKGFLTGAVHLYQLPKGQLNATGELSVRDGKYQAYGQELTIAQGQLLFTGGSVTNPGIQVRAIRQFDNAGSAFSGSNRLLDFNPSNLQTFNFGGKITVGIEVTGRLNSPKVELFSIPGNLSQADILSMLLLGRPVRQAGQAGGQLLLSAISSMNLGSGTHGMQLLDQLKQTLGLDISLQSHPQYDRTTNQVTDRSSVMVGKSLSKRLYISYNFGLGQTDSNIVTLTYLLNKFFSIQVNTSLTGSGIDLLYTHQKE